MIAFHWENSYLVLARNLNQDLSYLVITVLKFSFSEKATKIWKNLPLVLTLLSKNNCFVKTGWRSFQILWLPHNIWTLKIKCHFRKILPHIERPPAAYLSVLMVEVFCNDIFLNGLVDLLILVVMLEWSWENLLWKLVFGLGKLTPEIPRK